MSTCFLLVQTLPGMEKHVHDRLQGSPVVAGAHILFGEQIAVKLKGAQERLESAAAELCYLDGVVRAALYKPRNANQ